jgi:uncharacterized membrane protein YgcG
MIRSHPWVIALGLVLAAPLAAQGTDEEARERARLPEPPTDYLLDAAELLNRHPERRAAISDRLRAFHAAHDLPVYVAIYGTLIDSTLSRRSRLLFDRWVGPDRDGIVIVFEADSNQREIVTPGTQYARPASASASLSRLPDHLMIPILAELRVTLEGVEDRVDFVDRSTEILTERVAGLLEEKPSEANRDKILRFVAVTLAVGVVLALLGVFVSRRLRRLEEKARQRFYFPEVMVGTRLGAPYAGGRHSEVDFSGTRTRPR